MNKHSIFFIAVFCIIISCTTNYPPTPPQYKTNAKVSSLVYKKDTTEIRKVINTMLIKHRNPFKSVDLFNSKTVIYIDSLIYGSDKLRMILFVISKNSTDKLLRKENLKKYFYNANYLFCTRESLNSPLKVYDYRGFNLVFFYSYSEIKEALNDYCFYRLSAESTKDDVHYNIDDIRFWRSDEFKLVEQYSRATQYP
jgi:hypothetical protein